jgi:hypothetical protein
MLTNTDRRARSKALEKLRETRIRNLRLLCEHYGSQSELARMLGCASPRINQLCGPNPTRNLAEEAARNYEAILKLPFGWLDIPR